MDDPRGATNLSARPFFATTRGSHRAQAILAESRRLDDAVGKATARLSLDDVPRGPIGLLEDLRKESS